MKQKRKLTDIDDPVAAHARGVLIENEACAQQVERFIKAAKDQAATQGLTTGPAKMIMELTIETLEMVAAQIRTRVQQ